MQSPVSQGVDWFHGGEIAIIARVARDGAGAARLHATLRDILTRSAPNHSVGGPESLRSIVFDAPHEDRSLAFVFQKLDAAGDVRDVKNAVERLHPRVGDMRSGDVEVLGIMPHWHMRAHEMASGGSPGSLPAPVPPDKVRRGRRWRYQPKPDVFRLADAGTPIPVAVLDTRINLNEVSRFEGNEQLREAVEWLQAHQQAPGELSQREWAEVAKHHQEPDGPRYVMADHGLFVSGLIHSLAPNAPVSLLPVLDEYGVGDLSLLLAALRELLDRKPASAPLIVNMSLGFRPHPAHLVAAWHGLDLPGTNNTYSPSYVLRDDDRNWHWVSENAPTVKAQSDLLQAGLGELGRYLSLNNCLVVAAAGNDSEAGEGRLEPRLPARFETVLGVAATRSEDAKRAASYSNVGDEQRRGDHVSTFGGERGEGWAPVDGVVGVYSGAFPKGDNVTGYAYWSGTSFATGLVSGMAANVWSRKPKAHASEILADVHEAALHSGTYVSELRTPSIEVHGDWD
jgi:subtilase family protein